MLDAEKPVTAKGPAEPGCQTRTHAHIFLCERRSQRDATTATTTVRCTAEIGPLHSQTGSVVKKALTIKIAARRILELDIVKTLSSTSSKWSQRMEVTWKP